MDTHEKILDTELRLFNESGTAQVSTNHIAEACGISPGNLYYHFRNKQEIIRELFQRLYAAWDTDLQLSQDRPPRLDDLQALVQTNYRIIWEYRFAYRELVALLRQDAELRAGFLAVRQRGQEGFHQLIEAFSATGVIHLPDDPRVIDELRELCWLVSEFWLTNLEVNGRSANEIEMQNGINLMLRILQPYLT